MNTIPWRAILRWLDLTDAAVVTAWVLALPLGYAASMPWVGALVCVLGLSNWALDVIAGAMPRRMHRVDRIIRVDGNPCSSIK